MDTQDQINRYAEKLADFLPQGTARYVAEFIQQYEIQFRISKKRKTKLGDYRQPYQGASHRISVNEDLNAYSFLVTTLHEIAHLLVFVQYGNRVQPHGEEWKMCFKKVSDPILSRGILPEDVGMALKNYLKNAKASSCSDVRLLRVLSRYDEKRGIRVEELKEGEIFKLNGITFVKGRKLRTRYECTALETQKKYRVLGVANIDEEKQIENE